jgi:heparinase II/III-like protein
LRRLIVIAGFAGVLLPMALIWLPAFRHYHVSPVALSPDEARQIVAGMSPRACTEFARHDIAMVGRLEGPVLDEAIQSMARQELRLPPNHTLRFSEGFSADELVQPGQAQLLIPSLIVPDAMVRAWQRTGDVRWLERAQKYLAGWWAFERDTRFPVALQWNDHAVASQVFALTRYLCAVLERPELDPARQAEALSMLFTSGERLAKDSYYTYRTNHGVMQNLALLHIAASFPNTELARRYGRIAAERLPRQLEYYLSAEGVVLEHSAGYHVLGVQLVGMTIRYLEALGKPLPAGIAERYAKALDFRQQMTRLDGTLPTWGNSVRDSRHVDTNSGDTDASASGRQPKSSARASSTWAIASGTAIWWQTPGKPPAAGRPAAQTLVTWSNFATQAHKHADEMSLLVWTDESDLLIASGYWPYDAAHLENAVGWAGSNAPRFVGEDAGYAKRGTTRLLGFTSSAALEFIDMERTTPGGGRLRRQIAYLRPDLWAVVDSSSGAGRDTEVSWIFDPGLKVIQSSPGGAFLLANGARTVARMDLSGCIEGEARWVKGTSAPFGGWTAADGEPVPAPTLYRKCRGQDHAGVLLQLEAADRLAIDFSAPDRWALKNAETGQTLLRRDGDALQLCGEGCVAATIQPEARDVAYRERADGGYRAMAGAYRYFRELMPYRIKASQALLACWLVQFPLVLVVAPRLRRWLAFPQEVFSALAIGFWSAIAVWLHFVYLV